MTHCKSHERLESFAALLSSAQVTGLQQPLFASSEPALVMLLSKYSSSPYQSTIPTLSLKNDISVAMASEVLPSEMTLHDIASLNLAIPIHLSRDEAGSAPVSLLNNISDSFMTLVDARLRSSVVALRRQTQKIGLKNAEEAKVLTKLLTLRPQCDANSNPSPIVLTTVVTSFRLLPSAQENVANEMVLPLVFEAIIDVFALGTMITVPIRAPGTISGALNPSDSLIEEVVVAFDTKALLQAMMKQARLVVKKTIAVATGLARKIVEPTPIPKEADLSPVMSSMASTSSSWLNHDTMNTPQHNMDLDFSHHMAQEPLPRTMSKLSEYQEEDTPNANENFTLANCNMGGSNSSNLLFPEYSIKSLFSTFDAGQQASSNFPGDYSLSRKNKKVSFCANV